MTTKGELAQVYLQNIRDNQIGGETDGISPEVAADLGFYTLEKTQELMAALPDGAHGARTQGSHSSEERRQQNLGAVRAIKKTIPPSPDLSW